MFSSFLCGRKVPYKQAEWHLNVTACRPFDLKGKREKGLVIPGLEVGVLCLSLHPQCQQNSPERAVARAELCVFHKHIDTPVNVVLGVTGLPGKPADEQETNLLVCFF